MFRSLNGKTADVRCDLKDASKRSVGRFAAFIPGAGVATKGREIKEKEWQEEWREGWWKKGGKNQIFRWKDQYNRMHLQICRINAYSAVAARVSTRTAYSLFLLAGGWRARARACARAFHPVHCTRSTAATPPFCRALGCARVGERARASRLRNHVSEENLAAGYFLKIRDFKIRVGKQPPLDSESGHP